MTLQLRGQGKEREEIDQRRREEAHQAHDQGRDLHQRIVIEAGRIRRSMIRKEIVRGDRRVMERKIKMEEEVKGRRKLSRIRIRNQDQNRNQSQSLVRNRNRALMSNWEFFAMDQKKRGKLNVKKKK